MQMTAIDATLKQLAEQLPKGQTRGNAPDVFQSLIDSLSTHIKAAIAAERAASAASAAEPADNAIRQVVFADGRAYVVQRGRRYGVGESLDDICIFRSPKRRPFALPNTIDATFDGIDASHWWLTATVR